jgi:hypothetical protein
MFYYGVQSWGNQELLFVHQMKSLNNLCGYIKYIQRSYKLYHNTNPTNRGPKIQENILRLFKLIDEYKWSSLIIRTLDCLVPESNKILYINKKMYIHR